MARESGGRGGSKALRREQDSRDKGIEELQQKNAKLIDDLARTNRDLARTNRDLVRTTRDRDRWKRRSEHLKKQLAAARRAGRRQAAPFAKDRPQGRGGRPRPARQVRTVRPAGDAARRPPQVDETHAERRWLRACPDCGGAVEAVPGGDAISGRSPGGAPHRAALRHRGRPLLAVSASRPGPPPAANLRRAGSGRRCNSVPKLVALVVRAAHATWVCRWRRSLHLLRTQVRPDRSRPGGLAQPAASQRLANAAPTYTGTVPVRCGNAPVVTPDETGWRVGAMRHWLWAFATPGDDGLRDSAPAAGSTTRQRSWEPTSPACSCATGGQPYRRFTHALHQSLCLAHLDHGERGNCSKTDHPLQSRGPLKGARPSCRPALKRARPPRRRASELTTALVSTRSAADCEAQLGRLIDKSPTLDAADRFAKPIWTNEFAGRRSLFLWDPSIDATNWRAEQAIRPAVVTRKVCGGNRTRHGADTQQVLSSVVRTARQRGLDLPPLIAEMLRAREPVVPEAFGLPPPPA